MAGMPGGSVMSGVKVSVLGAGVSGLSLARLASRLGAEVHVSDAKKITGEIKDTLKSEGISYEEGGHSDKIMNSDLVVLSSGFPPSAEIVDRVLKRGVSLSGELDFVMPYLNGRFIAVTGSNGKTTTTSMIGYLLQSLGHRVATVGNIGSPIADACCAEYDYIVAELSSFQLHWASSMVLDAAVITNIAPDHIDWHGSYDNYIGAKARILAFVKKSGFVIARREDAEILKAREGNAWLLSWERVSDDREIFLDADERRACLNNDVLFSFDNISLLGRHNIENTAMSMACISLLGEAPKRAEAFLKGYTPPPHRCSLVLSSGGVTYVDDSKGTNIAAVVTALSSIEGRKIIILGGRGKGEDYRNLLPALKQYAKYALVIGEAAPEIASALREGGYLDFETASCMEGAVQRAASIAESGDVVLLSPACTSWDMYANYGERGEHFALLVRKYAQKDHDARG